MDLDTISVGRLALAFIPVAAVVAIMAYWKCGVGRALHAIGRMLLQLTLIGYVLVYIFRTESSLVVSGVLSVMVVAASWIALNTVDLPRRTLFPASLVSVALGGGATLVLVTRGWLDEWGKARFWCAFEMRRAEDEALLVTCRQQLAVVRMPAGRPLRLPAEPGT